jgi:hypothetical protein
MAAPIRTVRTKPSGIAPTAPNVTMKFIVPLPFAMENGLSMLSSITLM